MTKVIATALSILLLAAVAFIAACTPAYAGVNHAPAVREADQPLSAHSAEDLYAQLGNVGLDKSRVYFVRDVTVDRGAFQLALDDGTIAFTEDVLGRVTGAFFEGDGEILLSPPDQAERASMILFTGAAILEEKFSNAYFRFNDNTFADLLPSLQLFDNGPAFVSQWNQTAQNLAESDALRLLTTFSQFLPLAGEGPRDPQKQSQPDDRLLHVRVQGRRLGNFDVYFDSNAAEQVTAGQLKTVEGVDFYDTWTSFAWQPGNSPSPNPAVRRIDVPRYSIRVDVRPPTEIDADTVLEVEVHKGGERAILFELSRFLRVRHVEMDGRPVEYIHNQALEGTQLSRRGNDLVAVVFPEPLRAGTRFKLRFVYGGEVLSEAGAGLLYVGARGIWYPNRGLAMSDFDLEFHYPPGWTLLATGKRSETSAAPSPQSAEEQVSHWVSERAIALAGFNLGKYRRATARAGAVPVEAYATSVVERGFPEGPAQAVVPERKGNIDLSQPGILIAAQPSPARNAQAVANTSARAIDFYSRYFGPYPYSQLALTQMPGTESQGWPGLVFLSSYSFLTPQEKSQLHMSAVGEVLSNQVVAHETAHQWWGDLVIWNGYRDQWIVEALANYSSLMLLESENPGQFHAVLNKYREDLLQKNKSDVALMEDGPVTFGLRLSCSQFPAGYEAISYGRGTWLLHMLRYMLRDAEAMDRPRKTAADGADREEPFLRALRRLRERYQGKSITTRELLKIFEDELPPSLRYEGRSSLDWFYEGWVKGTAVPRIELRTAKFFDKAGSTLVSGTIVQQDAPKDLVTPVPVYASAAGRLVFLGSVFADGPETSFHLTAPTGTRKIVLDPNQRLLARLR